MALLSQQARGKNSVPDSPPEKSVRALAPRGELGEARFPLFMQRSFQRHRKLIESETRNSRPFRLRQFISANVQ